MSTLPSTLPFGIVASAFAGQRVHFIGIGGSGMSGLARILLDAGAIVSGSEPKPTHVTFQLMQRGARVVHVQDGSSLTPEINLVVRTAAVREGNPELEAARRLGLPVVKYAELLGRVMAERVGIAVAGTHGKSTTTAMTALILTRLGHDPSWVVGGTVPQLGGGSASGGGDVFVAEACEYDRSFHHLRPTVAVITNIDADHLDVYGGLDDIIESFRTFAGLVPVGGRIVTLGGDAAVNRAIGALDVPMDVVQVVAGEEPSGGLADGDRRRRWRIRPLADDPASGCPRAWVEVEGAGGHPLALAVPGRHNLLNATMAVAAAHAAGADLSRAFAAVAEFTGVDRRMQVLGRVNGALVVDDYGHHPTEIRATLEALRQRYRPQRLICVFQPHQASRTRLLFEEFAAAFTDADLVLMPEIYYVRDSEEDRQAVSSAKLAAAICRNGVTARFVPTYEQCVESVRREARADDLVVTMGAGPVCEVARMLTAAAPDAPG